jgi:hypothetical protein
MTFGGTSNLSLYHTCPLSILVLPAIVSKCGNDPFLYINVRVMPEGINGDDVTPRTIIWKFKQWKAKRQGSVWIAVWYVTAFVS